MRYVEYIQTDQYCWFDTGIIPSFNTSLELDLVPLSRSGNWKGYVGAQNADDDNSTYQIRTYSGSNQFAARIGNGNGNVGPSYTVGQRYLLTLDSSYLNVNGSNYSMGSSSMDTCNYTLYISAIHNPSWSGTGSISDTTNYRAAAGIFYGLKVYESGVLVGEFKPALDNNNKPGFYDTVSGNFYYNEGTGTPVVGPILSSIDVVASETIVKATGGTISFDITCNNTWEVTDSDNWLVWSSTGGTGDDTITATAPNYTGTTERTSTVTFTDTDTGDEVEINIKQKKVQNGQPVYLGGTEISELYLGNTAITEAYLGTVLVYSSGPFTGLKITPSSLSFNGSSLEKTINVKSSESWTLTLPSWLTADTLTGDTGETVVSLTATTLSTGTTDTIYATSANYSASAECKFFIYQQVPYIHSTIMGNEAQQYLTTSIYPTLTLSGRVSGQFRGYNQGGVYIGTANNDNRDWRLFVLNYGSTWYMDVSSGRKNGNIGVSTTGQDFTIDFGNLYIKNVLDDISLTGSTQAGTIESFPVKIDLGITWISEVKLYDNNTLVFDGVAAEFGGEYGLYDRVTDTFLTDPSLNIVPEL